MKTDPLGEKEQPMAFNVAFIPLDYCCPTCNSRAASLNGRVVHTQPANSRFRILDISDIFFEWTLYCFDCKTLFVKESAFTDSVLSRIRNGGEKIFFGAGGRVEILPNGTVLKVKYPVSIVLEKGAPPIKIPETVTI